MRQLRGRFLHPEPGPGDGGCHDSYADGCPLPPPPPPPRFVLYPAPSPAPTLWPARWPSWSDPGPPVLAPSPAPVHGAAGGRRDQGRVSGYGSPPGVGGGGDDDHRSRLVMYALIAVAAIAFVSLILLGVSVAMRRRQVRRRRQQALLAAAADTPPAAAANEDDPEGGGGGVVHHVWYIRTVGLDEAVIASIAATRYRAGAGLLGAADCTVCLGEFQDGELVRLLPRCGHAFHVPCIDTWLRAHVNCPLCRSDVLDPAVTADSGSSGERSSSPQPDPVANDDAVAEQAAAAASDAITEHEEEENAHREASPAEEDQHEQQSSLPEPLPQPPCPLPQNVRRAASMDAATVSTAADVAAASERLPEAAPEEEQSGRRKRGTGPFSVKSSGSGHRSNLSIDRPAAGGIPSFFARHCRARSSVLPL